MQEQPPIEDQTFDLTPYANTDLALEAGLGEGDEFWATTSVAGLQFYAYGTHDELVGEVIPPPGDRLTIMRRPENYADANACEVWWRNCFHLGHLPRGVAAELAPALDAGKGLRAYVIDPGDGSTWSVRLVLVGSAAEALHGRRLKQAAADRRYREKEEIWLASLTVWPEESYRDVYVGKGGVIGWAPLRRRPVPRPPTERQQAAALAFEQRQELARRRRAADAVFAFSLAPEERETVPADADDIEEDLLGTFHLIKDADVEFDEFEIRVVVVARDLPQ
ncbi:HIRAN domain-containing protein [Azospirillum melinis]|uniref:HIRAN domain-containing protein n=1 Tax=Azospirillum melinis TaxID=328839 RepID=UPI00375740DE